MFDLNNFLSKKKNKIMLAPMAGITNQAFRKICKKFGSSILFSEMVNDIAINNQNKKTLNMLKFSKQERPFAIQIFGNNSQTISNAAKYIEDNFHPDLIDINMGCPMPKITNRGSGASLLKNVKKIQEIVERTVSILRSTPVSVKIRSGWNESTINVVEVAKCIEKAGAKLITIHPRTCEQKYTGIANWEIIKEVKQNVKIPVIGNGDVCNCEDAKKMILETGCDAVMIGRKSIGNPWIFKECKRYLLKNKKPKEISFVKKVKVIKMHLKLLEKNQGTTIVDIKPHISYYFRYLKNKNFLTNEFYKLNNYNDIVFFLNKIKKTKYTKCK
ncbi:MAG: tRNA dihydrouridine synthase DusB [Mycoplasmataceae bacterium]|nr:tRNA dihydrouridine synthase DusB [Mycoplasmataceae bacterium]